MYKIKSRIWVELDGKMFLGEGRIQLLKSIERTNSLSKSAKELNISYKKAWNLIDSVNKESKEPMVIKSTGGSGGGGTVVTAYGKQLIEAFEIITENSWSFLDKQSEKILSKF